MARASRSRALNRLDLPTLGRLAVETAGVRRLEERVHTGGDGGQGGLEFRGHEFRQVFLGEVHGGFDPCEGLQERFAHACDGLGQGARGGGVGGAESGPGACADPVDHGLGLHQIDAAVEKRALGEFAGLGEARAVPQDELEDGLKRSRAAVGVDLDDVFAGVAVGGAHDVQEHLVEGLAVVSADFPVTDAPARGADVESRR